MSAASNVVRIGASPSIVEHLIAAHGLAGDPVSKALIEAALIHEGKKIAASVPQNALGEEREHTGT